MGLYRWDLECLLDTLSLEMTDRPLHPAAAQNRSRRAGVLV